VVSKSPNWGYSPSKRPKWLVNGGYYLHTNWDDTPRTMDVSDSSPSRKRRLVIAIVCEQWKKPWFLGSIVDGILPSYMGVIICHYKDPYYATTTMENKRSFSWLIVRNILRCCCNTPYMDDDEVCNGKCPSDVKEIQLSWMMIQAEIGSTSCFLDSKNIDHIGYQSGCHPLILCFGQCKILKVVNFWVCGPSDRFCWVLGIRWSNFSPSFEKH